jgi:uncharacterized protein Veg
MPITTLTYEQVHSYLEDACRILLHRVLLDNYFVKYAKTEKFYLRSHILYRWGTNKSWLYVNSLLYLYGCEQDNKRNQIYDIPLETYRRLQNIVERVSNFLIRELRAEEKSGYRKAYYVSRRGTLTKSYIPKMFVVNVYSDNDLDLLASYSNLDLLIKEYYIDVEDDISWILKELSEF